jgi:hypothetical protein
MGEINVIFRGSMSITSKTQGKKLQHEISLAQRMKLARRRRWSNAGPEDHPDTELLDRNLSDMELWGTDPLARRKHRSWLLR